MRSYARVVAAFWVLGAAFLTAPARADVSSWLFTGGGASIVDRSGSRTTLGAIQIDAGMGSSPSNLFAVGGLARLNTYFSQGSDVALLFRTATAGYVRGTFGMALDLGGYYRFWADQKPGFAGGLSFGAPWGITLNVDAAVGPDQFRTYALVLGVDLARLTVHRSIGMGWWPNPYPSPRSDRVE